MFGMLPRTRNARLKANQLTLQEGLMLNMVSEVHFKRFPDVSPHEETVWDDTTTFSIEAFPQREGTSVRINVVVNRSWMGQLSYYQSGETTSFRTTLEDGVTEEWLYAKVLRLAQIDQQRRERGASTPQAPAEIVPLPPRRDGRASDKHTQHACVVLAFPRTGRD